MEDDNVLPHVPEVAHGLTLGEVNYHVDHNHGHIKELSCPEIPSDPSFWKESEVEKTNRYLDDPEGERVQQLKDEEYLKEVCYLVKWHEPDVDAESVLVGCIWGLSESASGDIDGEDLPMMPPARNTFCSTCCAVSFWYRRPDSWRIQGVLTQAITIVVSSGPHGASFRILDDILMRKKIS